MPKKFVLLFYSGLLAALGLSAILTLSLYGLPAAGIEGLYAKDYRQSMDAIEGLANHEQESMEQLFGDRRRELRLMTQSEDFQATVAALANDHGILKSRERERLQRQLMATMGASSAAYKFIYVVAPEGDQVFASTLPQWDRPPPEHRTALQQAAQAGQLQSVHVLNDASGPGLLVTFQIRGQGEDGVPNARLLGTLLANLRLTTSLERDELSMQHTLGLSGAVWLLDSGPTVLFRYPALDEEGDGKYVADLAHAESPGVQAVTMSGGRVVLTAVRRLHLGTAEDVTLVITRGKSESMAAFDDTFVRLTAFGCAVFLLVMGVVVLAVNRVSNVQAQLRKLSIAVDQSLDAILMTDVDSRIEYVNDSFTKLFGYSRAESIGQAMDFFNSERHGSALQATVRSAILCAGKWEGEIWSQHKSGEASPCWVSISAVKDNERRISDHFIATYTDITERKKVEKKINELAYYDQLTGLPNRTLLLDHMRLTMATSSRNASFCALLFLDLDNFKTLNDTLGHEVGDVFLKQVAQRLTKCVREVDFVARLGGDEFVLILAELGTVESDAARGAETVTTKILAKLSQPYQFGNVDHTSTASVGITMFRGDVTAMDDLMKQADLAMYRSKAAGRNTTHFFDPVMESTLRERAALEADLLRAVEHNQFLLYYQAQIVDERQLAGAEALIRWQHPQRGLVLPSDFISLTEDLGLILRLGHWVMREACRQLALWAERPEMRHLTIAVNVSARQFRHPDFVEEVMKVIHQTGANPDRLKMELTESILVSDIENVIAKMSALKARGISFSLDDFGTGFSSLSYLRRLPLDQLKIDKSFVRDVLIDHNDAVIAKAIVALADSLGLSVIAEGVETTGQRDFLSRAGCHAYQGYLFSRPLPLEAFEAFAAEIETLMIA
jgi:diguanylate cyclase (GGDEF)-like protein/PAS domain S-box-containing protein